MHYLGSRMTSVLLPDSSDGAALADNDKHVAHSEVGCFRDSSNESGVAQVVMVYPCGHQGCNERKHPAGSPRRCHDRV